MKHAVPAPRLVPPSALRDLWRALSFLDAVLEPDWAMRQYSFDARWAPGEEVGFRRNGEGDHAEAWFSKHGAVLRGFLLDSPMSPLRHQGQLWPGLLHGLPAALRAPIEEPAFARDELTFCRWAPAGSTRWQHGRVSVTRGEEDADGSGYLLELLGGDPRAYVAYAGEYFERRVDLDDVRSVYRAAHTGEPLDAAIPTRLQPDASAREVARAARELGLKMGTKKTAPKKKAAKVAKKAPAKRAAPAQADDADDDDSFGEASFVVTVGRRKVQMIIHGKKVVAETGADIYEELFDLVAARIKASRKK